MLDLEYKRFYCRGIGAAFKLLQRERFNVDIVGRAQFAGFEEDDSSFLAGIGERRGTFELGLKSEWKMGVFAVEAVAG